MARRSRIPLSAPEPLRTDPRPRGREPLRPRAGGHPGRPLEGRRGGPHRRAGASRCRSRTATLLLRVPTSVWANELSLLADEVCARLKERGVGRARAPLPRRGGPDRRAAPRAPDRPGGPGHPRDPRRGGAGAGGRERPGASSGHRERGRGEPGVAIGDAAGAPQAALTEAQRAVRAPRSAGGESAPPDRTSPASPGAPPDTRGGGRRRSR